MSDDAGIDLLDSDCIAAGYTYLAVTVGIFRSLLREHIFLGICNVLKNSYRIFHQMPDGSNEENYEE